MSHETTLPRETEWARRMRREAERTEWLRTHDNRCELCDNPPKSRGLSEDHDHRTGRHRGWLDHRCNRALPAWITPLWLVKAALYLLGAKGDLTDAEHFAVESLTRVRAAIELEARP